MAIYLEFVHNDFFLFFLSFQTISCFKVFSTFPELCQFLSTERFYAVHADLFLYFFFMYIMLEPSAGYSIIVTSQTNAGCSISSVTRITSAAKRTLSVGTICISVTIGKSLRAFVQICRVKERVSIKNSQDYV